MAKAELITLGEETYNVTLIAGKPEDRNGQKRIRVNTRTLKMANKDNELPEKLSMEGITPLTTLCDKYDVCRIVGIHVREKQWLKDYREVDGLWKRGIDVLSWIGICRNF
ncbi:hypothetical protein P154DRAFT_571319 [Amniculicola lignicola CBS 123094]|uniref:Uncharacterized protein n=1 Tax=Amniculicola lignicola CBS 123094 TaxID=1392246 RepID=A0A6A5X0Z4_9PLEO|nr:hypothetical protein P154DRAFT_571319 [Amniculicola lignicola CBS 123094]